MDSLVLKDWLKSEKKKKRERSSLEAPSRRSWFCIICIKYELASQSLYISVFKPRGHDGCSAVSFFFFLFFFFSVWNDFYCDVTCYCLNVQNKGLKCVNIPCSMVLFFWGQGTLLTMNGIHAVGPVVFIALEVACTCTSVPF